MAEQTDAAKRAAARKAKILARGNSGLAKLAQTARGDEAETLYGDIPSRTASPAQSQPTATSTGPSWAPPSSNPSASSKPTGPSTSSTSRSNAPRAPSGQPSQSEQQRQMQEQLAQMFGGAFGQPPSGAGGGDPMEGGMPDFQKIMAQMMGMDPSSAGGANLLGDMDDPAGLGGGPNPFGPGGMPDLSALGGLGGLGGMPGMGGMGGMPGMPGMGGVRPRNKVDKYWGLVHFVAVSALAILALGWWEPALRLASRSKLSAVAGKNVSGWTSRWAGLGGGRGVIRVIKDEVLGGVEVVPLFWAFTTLQLILQTTRFFILKSPPPPHSLLGNFLPLIPPKIASPLLTGSRYITLLTQTYKDGALLVFFIGLAISVAPYFTSSSVFA